MKLKYFVRSLMYYIFKECEYDNMALHRDLQIRISEIRKENFEFIINKRLIPYFLETERCDIDTAVKKSLDLWAEAKFFNKINDLNGLNIPAWQGIEYES